MKCPNWGFENADTAKFCEKCGEPFAEKEETPVETPAEQPQPEPETQPEEEKTEPKAKKQAPKIQISDETKQKISAEAGNTFKYLGRTILHPSVKQYDTSWSTFGIVTLMMWIVNWLWLYIMERGLIQTIFGPVSGEVKNSMLLSSGYAFLMAIVFVFAASLLAFITQFINKDRKSFKRAVADGVHVCVVPTVLLLVATVVGAFWYTIGMYCVFVAFIAFFMNLVQLFAGHQNYLSYILVTLTMTAIMIAFVWIGAQVIGGWEIGGMKLAELLQNQNLLDLLAQMNQGA
mgnify:CR=1 FL=1